MPSSPDSQKRNGNVQPEDHKHNKTTGRNTTEKTADQRNLEEDERKSSSSKRSRKKLEHMMGIKSRLVSMESVDTQNTAESAFFDNRIDPDEPLPASSFVSWQIEQPVALHLTKTGPLAQKPITTMTVLKDTANKYPTKLAYASMVDGEWVKLNYQNFLDQVQQAAQGFIKLGLRRFNGVGIMGGSAIEFIVAHLGAIFAGGISVPLRKADDFALDLLRIARCRILVVDSIKQRKQVLEWRQNLPQLKAIVQYGRDSFDKSGDLYTWQEFMKKGKDVSPEVLNERTLHQAPNVCCCIVQTVGTSGLPKNVMLSHDNMVWGSYTIGRYMSLSDGQGVFVNIVPLFTIFGLTLSVNLAARFASSVYLLPATRNKALLLQTLKEVRPTIFFAPTVFYQVFRLGIEGNMKSNFFKRIVSNWAMKIGRKAFDDKSRLSTLPTCWSLANTLVFQKVRKNLGFDRCNEFFAAGGFLLRSDLDFFLSIDMPLVLAYGMAESSGTHTACLQDRFRIDSVGIGLDGCKTTIFEPDTNGVGELHIAGRNVAMGYLESEELTTKSFRGDGTFRTGDMARKDEDGFTYIVGKMSDIVTLSGGEKIMTIPIKVLVHLHLPFVSHAVVVGEGKPYLSLLMTIKTEIDAETELPTDRVTPEAQAWFRKAGYEVKNVRDIVPKANPKLLDKIQKIVDKLNAESPHESHRIKRWTILSNDFSPGTDELGPTYRLRRWLVEKKYAATIDSMYP